MAIIATERPGIYSSYEASKIIWGTGNGKKVGIVCSSTVQGGQVYNMTRLSDVSLIFGNNSLMYRLCEIAFNNGASEIAGLSAGDETIDYKSAFDLLKNENDIGIVICDSEDTQVHELLKDSILEASNNLKERIGIVSCSKDEDVTTWSENYNCERLVLVAQSPLDDNGNVLTSCLIAAALAGVISKNVDPSISFNDSQLNGINSLDKNLTEDEIDIYIKNGITPFEVTVGKVEAIRVVTSKTNTDGVMDKTFKDLNTILVMDYVISGVRNVLDKYLYGTKNNSVTRKSIATQTTIQLEEYRSSGIIDYYESPMVAIDSDDPSICIVEIQFTISHALNQIQILANIKV